MINNEMIEKLVAFKRYNGFTISTIQKVSKISKRAIQTDIKNINDNLSDYVNIFIDDKEIVRVESRDIDEIIKAELFHTKNFLFQNERPCLIVIYLFIKNDFISMLHLQDLLSMSKNTVLNDINEIKNLNTDIQVEVTYTRQSGYHLSGTRTEQRKLVEIALAKLLPLSSGKWIIQYLAKSLNIELYPNEIRNIITSNPNVKIIDDKIEGMVYLLALLQANPQQSKENTDDDFIERNNQLYSLDLNRMVNQLIEQFPELVSEENYIVARLLSVIQGDLNKYPDKYFVDLMERIIINVKVYAGNVFPETEMFRRNLYNHLVPAYFRLKYGVMSVNPLKEQIMNEYKELFFLMQKSLKPLAEDLGIKLTDDEIAYFVMHFGGYFTREYVLQEQPTLLKAAIICPHGVGTSLVINDQLSELMPEISFENFSRGQFDEISSEQFDFLISTENITFAKPLYLINTNFTWFEAVLLKRKIYTDYNIKIKSMKQADEIVSLLSDYYDINENQALQIELDIILDKDLKLDTKLASDDSGGKLADYLELDQITLMSELNSWETAIRIGSEPLLKKGIITADYIEAMIQAVELYGPYIVIAPKVAMPHAKPENGAVELGISLLKLDKPIYFNESDEKAVNIFFIISIPDQKSHLKLLKAINKLVEDEDKVKRMILSPTKEELINVIKEIEDI